jgi:hypothetical protein
VHYSAFTDPSGGRHDWFTMCVGHLEGELFVADVVRGARPPFDPHEVVKEYAALCREYRVYEVHGDKYAAEWTQTAFKDAGLRYRQSEKEKSRLYIEALPIFTRAQISVPDHPQLLRELRLLERATHRGGRDSVDHPRNGSDDLANVERFLAAVAMAIVVVLVVEAIGRRHRIRATAVALAAFLRRHRRVGFPLAAPPGLAHALLFRFVLSIGLLLPSIVGVGEAVAGLVRMGEVRRAVTGVVIGRVA